ncbi:MAG: MFS transporter [Acidimicrobiia bacterium]|nr:MFS transporter [Acidimicrobiia bacterium]MYC44974.1 MFS transporter [Acidimicrobiia bacterium]MYI19492.1 MFS transporter [Acidimicrobiia bacterium]
MLSFPARIRPPAVVVGSCTLAIAFNSAYGYVPGFMATALRADLGIDRWHVGLLVSLYFGCAGLASLAAGRVCDRIGGRFTVVAGMAFVVVASALAAGVGGYAALPVAGVLAGLGYSLNNVGTNVAVAGAVTPRRRAVALSTRSSGILLMSALTAAIAPTVADRWDWRWVYGGLGAGGAVMAVVALGVLRDDTGDPHELLRRRSHRLPRGFVWFPIAAFCLIAGAQPLLSWTVPYAEESLGLSPAWAGILVGASSAVGAVAMVSTGVGADRLGAHRRIRLLVALVAGTGVSCLLLAGGQVLGLPVAMVGVLGGIILQFASIGTMHAAVVDRAGPAVARATAATMTGYYLGALVSPVAFGAFVDGVGSYEWAWLILGILLGASAVAFRQAGRIAPAD